MRRKASWRLLPWQRQAILDAYADDEKVEAIAAEFEVSVAYVPILAKRNGLPLRQPRKVKQFPEAVLAA